MIFPRIDLSHLPINPYGLVGYWSSLRGPVRPGGTVYDLSGRGNHGICNGDTHWIPGSGGQFDGDGDYVDVSDNGLSFTSSDNWTIGGWIKYDSSVNEQAWIGARDWGGFLTVRRGNVDRISFRETESNSYTWNNLGDHSFNGKGWFYTVVTYKSSGEMKSYLNGEFLSSGTGVNGDIPINSIGEGDKGSYPFELNGSIDDVQIFDRVLSSTEIQQIYNSTYFRFY